MKSPDISHNPVPTEQQPLYQYQELLDSWFFSWLTLDWSLYLIRLIFIWSLSWIIVGPIAAYSYQPLKFPIQFFILGTLGSSLGVFALLVYLYLGWSYIKDRLYSETIVYEESGWYDGQTWTKPESILTRDRLIVTYQLQPLFWRLYLSFSILFGLIIIASSIWLILTWL